MTSPQPASAQGVAEIKVGNISPYSGPASAFSVVSKTEAAYFRKINEEGGVNGRKINFISYDDGYSPPKAVEQARKLVESDEVLMVFQSLGTPSNSAIQRYMNAKKVPQLFVGSGAARFGDPEHFPWTMNWPPNYVSEGKIYARYILDQHPRGKIAVLYQNDDFGKDIRKGLKDGLGDAAKSMIVAEASYDVSDTTVDSPIVKMKASGADIFMNVATPKFAAQAIRKIAELDWRPMHLITTVSNAVGSVLDPAGLQNSKGILSTAYMKDPTDSSWKDDPALAEWDSFMRKYYPDGDRTNSLTVYGYLAAQLMVQVLKQCGDELTRENVMRQAASLKDFEMGMLLPDIRINTGPKDYAPVEQMQMMRFTGEKWERFGPILAAEGRR
jgi:branched-chain amino acid transport system substrate-binding protein